MPLDGAKAPRRAKPAVDQDVRYAAAWEYHEASLGLRAAEQRRTRAQALAVRVGVLPDHLNDPLPVGTSAVVYADAAVVINVQVFAPIVGVDVDGLEASLVKAGVKLAVVRRAFKANRTETRPAHKFTSSAL